MMYISAHYWKWKSFPLHSVTPFLTMLTWFSLLHRNLWEEKCLYALSVQSLSCVQLFETPWTAVCQASLSITNSQSLLKLMSIEWAMPFNHPLSSPSPSAFNLSQHQNLFQWASSLHQVTKVLEFWLQHQSFQLIFRTFPLGWTGWISCSPRDPQESSPAPQFKSINSLLLSIPSGLAGQESACNAGDLGLIPGLEKTPGKGPATHASIPAWRIPWSPEEFHPEEFWS